MPRTPSTGHWSNGIEPCKASAPGRSATDLAAQVEGWVEEEVVSVWCCVTMRHSIDLLRERRCANICLTSRWGEGRRRSVFRVGASIRQATGRSRCRPGAQWTPCLAIVHRAVALPLNLRHALTNTVCTLCHGEVTIAGCGCLLPRDALPADTRAVLSSSPLSTSVAPASSLLLDPSSLCPTSAPSLRVHHVLCTCSHSHLPRLLPRHRPCQSHGSAGHSPAAAAERPRRLLHRHAGLQAEHQSSRSGLHRHRHITAAAGRTASSRSNRQQTSQNRRL